MLYGKTWNAKLHLPRTGEHDRSSVTDNSAKCDGAVQVSTLDYANLIEPCNRSIRFLHGTEQRLTAVLGQKPSGDSCRLLIRDVGHHRCINCIGCVRLSHEGTEERNGMRCIFSLPVNLIFGQTRFTLGSIGAHKPAPSVACVTHTGNQKCIHIAEYRITNSDPARRLVEASPGCQGKNVTTPW